MDAILHQLRNYEKPLFVGIYRESDHSRASWVVREADFTTIHSRLCNPWPDVQRAPPSLPLRAAAPGVVSVVRSFAGRGPSSSAEACRGRPIWGVCLGGVKGNHKEDHHLYGSQNLDRYGVVCPWLREPFLGG